MYSFIKCKGALAAGLVENIVNKTCMGFFYNQLNMFIFTLNMKRTVLLLTAVLLVVCAEAQRGRSGDTNRVEIKEVRSTLEKATGWANKGGGDWINAKNKIPAIMTQKSADQIAEGATSKRESRRQRKKLKSTEADKELGQENFIEMEMMDIMVNNQAFQGLIIKKEAGEYEFPMIKEGFSKYKALEYYVFRSEKINQILPNPLVFNQPYVVDLKVFASGDIQYYENKEINTIIKGKIKESLYKKNLKSFNPGNLLMALYPVVYEGDKLMRFNFIRTYNKYYVNRSYFKDENLQQLFNSQYFETDFDRFKDFIGTPNISLQYADEEPTTFEGYCRLGVNQYQYGDYYNAVASLNKALRMNPEYSQYLLFAHRANAKFKLGDYYGAVEDFNRALDYEPTAGTDHHDKWLQCYYNRGVIKYHLGDINDACADWKKAYEMGAEKAGDLIKKHCQ